MKHTLRNFWLLLCLLLSIFVLRSVYAIGDPAHPDVIIDLSWTVQHTSRLHTLSLWNVGMTGGLQVIDGKLRFTNWLIVWDDDHIVSVGSNGHAVIGGWKRNTVGTDFAAIWWWLTNKALAAYSVVAWWQSNTGQWQNSVVVGWNANVAGWQNSVVVWWQGNVAEWQNSVVIGGYENTANRNSLALWKNAEWREGSFAWNALAPQKWGYISATSWILVGTTTPIDLVNLVVGGAIRIAWDASDIKTKWEIRYVGWCFYAYDGDKWHILNRWEEKWWTGSCNAWFPGEEIARYCEFGNTIVWNGDQVTAYDKPYATGDNCGSHAAIITCNNWTFSSPDYIYPYCYSINY